MIKFALIGNQNCGKTTLFNQLTGSNQHVGNFPGVTVDKKEGQIKKKKNTTVVDLPGIYSLSPYTAEEIVTRDFLINERPDAIINILDANNIERNLYLSLQLIELNMPMILALNMMDEIRAGGGSIDINALSEGLGVPVVPISASKNEGVSELVDQAIQVAIEKKVPKASDFCSGNVHKAIHSVSHIVEEKAKLAGIPKKFAATKLVEGDTLVLNQLNLDDEDIDIIGHIVEQMEQRTGLDREAALADMRYNCIESLCKKTVVKSGESKEQLRSIAIDKLLTHKILAIPIFLFVMLGIFYLTFTFVGGTLSQMLGSLMDKGIEVLSTLLIKAGVNDLLHSLIINGICPGVASVLSFLPTIVTLFFFLSILEDSGYMARVAFVMDKLLRKIGLSGRSFVPMLIGFGCSVPAIMATRTLPSERDRKMTIILTPFMSCSAKITIYSMFTLAFFPHNTALVMFSIYIIGILTAIIVGVLLKSTVFKGNPVPFVMELPTYRFPSAKSVVLHMWDKANDFIKKAFTVILICSIIIWFLQSFDYKLNMVESQNSMLAFMGRFIADIFKPLGFGDWRAATALVTGLGAKENVISTLSILTGAVNSSDLANSLHNLFHTNAAAYSFLIFTALYMPCVAAMAAVRREFKSTKKAIYAMAFQTGVAYIVALITFSVLKFIIK